MNRSLEYLETAIPQTPGAPPMVWMDRVDWEAWYENLERLVPAKIEAPLAIRSCKHVLQYRVHRENSSGESTRWIQGVLEESDPTLWSPQESRELLQCALDLSSQTQGALEANVGEFLKRLLANPSFTVSEFVPIYSRLISESHKDIVLAELKLRSKSPGYDSTEIKTVAETLLAAESKASIKAKLNSLKESLQ